MLSTLAESPFKHTWYNSSSSSSEELSYNIYIKLSSILYVKIFVLGDIHNNWRLVHDLLVVHNDLQAPILYEFYRTGTNSVLEDYPKVYDFHRTVR